VSKRLGSIYRRVLKVKNPNAPAVKREAEEDWERSICATTLSCIPDEADLV